MISIVVCSRSASMLKQFEENVSDTIGVDFEVIGIDNSKNDFSICEAYNEGIARATYSFVCFAHEDVLFETKNWGKALINVMQSDPQIGLIGVAGSKARPRYNRNIYHKRNFNVGHIKQGLDSWEEYENVRFGNYSKDIDDVVYVDGVFMFTRREITDSIKFDAAMLKGFHGYDIDFCLQVFSKKKRVVVFEKLDIYHYSPGKHNAAFFESTKLISTKWKKLLPFFTADVYPGKWNVIKLELDIYFHYENHLVAKGVRKIKHKLGF